MNIYEWVQAVQERLGDQVSRRISGLLKLGLVGLLGLVILGVAGMEFSSSPKFCVMCHYMRPYYESWKTSSHKDVPCLDCHFPPGVQSKLRRKFEALVQVAKYATRQYGTRAWTEIEDASCLRSGCHQKRVLSGKVSFDGIDFDHQPHLTKFRRVTRLRCTSCHSQLVQGEHMTVTKQSCYLCHLKKGPELETMSECTVCHSFPIETAAGSVDHTLVEEHGVDCLACHANVIQGEGEVPEDRCILCHSEPEHLELYSDTAFMHFNHVTAHKIECTQCHNSIEHRSPEAPAQHPALGKSEICGQCHQSQHQTVQALYAGRGGFGIQGTADPMFEAGVTCEACHRGLEGVGPPSTARPAGAAGCMYCHGEEYGSTLAQWLAEFGGPVDELLLAVLRAKRLVASIPSSRQGKPAAWDLVQEARANVQLVQVGNGVHNPVYARQLLQQAVSQANAALALVGSDYRVPAPKAITVGGESKCLNCHTAVPTASQRIYGVSFSHTNHVQTAGLSCERCHSDGSPEKPSHGQMHLTAGECRSCHIGKVGSPHPRAWEARHGLQAKKNPQQCQVCHSKRQCSTCHGLAMPHPRDWSALHGTQAKDKTDMCNRCHEPQEQECTSCHGLQMPHPDAWLEQHGTKANKSPDTCRTCHESVDCLSCHEMVPVPSHNEDWSGSHGAAGAGQPGLCELCHKDSRGDSCLTCHGVSLPHSENYAMEHSGEASFDTGGVCSRCHDLAEDCAMCHGDVLE